MSNINEQKQSQNRNQAWLVGKILQKFFVDNKTLPCWQKSVSWQAKSQNGKQWLKNNGTHQSVWNLQLDEVTFIKVPYAHNGMSKSNECFVWNMKMETFSDTVVSLQHAFSQMKLEWNGEHCRHMPSGQWTRSVWWLCQESASCVAHTSVQICQQERAWPIAESSISSPIWPSGNARGSFMSKFDDRSQIRKIYRNIEISFGDSSIDWTLDSLINFLNEVYSGGTRELSLLACGYFLMNRKRETRAWWHRLFDRTCYSSGTLTGQSLTAIRMSTFRHSSSTATI